MEDVPSPYQEPTEYLHMLVLGAIRYGLFEKLGYILYILNYELEWRYSRHRDFKYDDLAPAIKHLIARRAVQVFLEDEVTDDLHPVAWASVDPHTQWGRIWLGITAVGKDAIRKWISRYGI